VDEEEIAGLGMVNVDVARKSGLGLSLDDDLHPFDLLEIQDEGVDNGIQGESLGSYTSGMGGGKLGAEIQVSRSLFGDKEVTQTGPLRNRGDELCPFRSLQEPSNQGLGCAKEIAGLNTPFLRLKMASANGAKVKLHAPPWGFVHGYRFDHLRAERPSFVFTAQPAPQENGGSDTQEKRAR
jgi:hypothetical protein